MHDWLANAGERELAEVATMATVMLTRITELSAARVQAKSVIDLLEDGNVPGARAMLQQAQACARELRSAVDALEELARTGT